MEDLRIHKMKLSEPWFSYVRNSEKSVELRANDKKRQQIEEYDIIQFSNDEKPQIFSKQVMEITHHDSFRDAIVYHGLRHVLPDVEALEDGVEIYANIPTYVEKETKFGVVAFVLSEDNLHLD